MRWIPRPMRYGLKQSLPWPSLHTLPSCPSLAKSSGVPRFLHLTSRSLESLADDVTERCWPLGLWGSDKVFTKRAFFSCCCQETILCWLKPFDCIVYIQWYFLVLLCEHGRSFLNLRERIPVKMLEHVCDCFINAHDSWNIFLGILPYRQFEMEIFINFSLYCWIT